jgi:hypothetical protein
MTEPGKDDGIYNKREQEREAPRIDQFKRIFSAEDWQRQLKIARKK